MRKRGIMWHCHAWPATSLVPRLPVCPDPRAFTNSMPLGAHASKTFEYVIYKPGQATSAIGQNKFIIAAASNDHKSIFLWVFVVYSHLWVTTFKYNYLVIFLSPNNRCQTGSTPSHFTPRFEYPLSSSSVVDFNNLMTDHISTSSDIDRRGKVNDMWAQTHSQHTKQGTVFCKGQ